MVNDPVNISMGKMELELLTAIQDNNGKVEIKELIKLKNKSYVEIMRLAKWLADENLIKIDTINDQSISLLPEGKKFAVEGLPERRIVQKIISLKEPVYLSTLAKQVKISENEVKISLGWLRSKKWANFSKEDKKIRIVVNKIPVEGNDEKLLKLLKQQDEIKISELNKNLKEGLESLRKRKELIEVNQVTDRYLILIQRGKEVLHNGVKITREVTQLTPELIKTGKWKDIEFKKFDIVSPVGRLYPGKSHPINNLIKEIREIFFEFGFEEIESPLVETTFWNFDALFVPQDHPARDSWDTFYLKNPPLGSLPSEKIVTQVKNTHENGGETGSKGWGYNWNYDEAKKLILRTHTTAATIRYAAMNPDPPKKVFCIDRLYRNEKQDYQHLAEFMQIEGIIIDNNASLKDLFGFLKDFYNRMGFPKIKFRPGYFPFTEPSVEADLYSPKLDKWLEMVGAGIFRPEVTEPLGIKTPILAWGMGFERLAMIRLGLNDMRKLYKNEINWLRDTPKILKRGL